VTGVDGDIERVPEHLSPATLKSAAEKRETPNAISADYKKAVFEAPKRSSVDHDRVHDQP
jgi:hypothetical protein